MNYIEFVIDQLLLPQREKLFPFQIQSFLKQRLNEYHVNETILMTFIMQNAPSAIQKVNENGKRQSDLKG
jgi:hypothetical protein